jgi:hypothetical protein
VPFRLHRRLTGSPSPPPPPPNAPLRRLLFGIFAEDGGEFLGSGVSGPIRVLANNDVPKGAACLRIRASLPGAKEAK